MSGNHLNRGWSGAYNITIGRVLCGWTILQSYGTYRITHVLNHHPKIGNDSIDPDLVYMLEQGVYKSQSRSDFLKNYFIKLNRPGIVGDLKL